MSTALLKGSMLAGIGGGILWTLLFVMAPGGFIPVIQETTSIQLYVLSFLLFSIALIALYFHQMNRGRWLDRISLILTFSGLGVLLLFFGAEWLQQYNEPTLPWDTSSLGFRMFGCGLTLAGLAALLRQDKGSQLPTWVVFLLVTGLFGLLFISVRRNILLPTSWPSLLSQLSGILFGLSWIGLSYTLERSGDH